MAGTNAVAAKKAVIDALTTRMTDTQVSYHYPGRFAERELVHAGRVEGSHQFHAMKGARTRHARQEGITFRLFVVVRIPGGDPYDAELRCTVLGAEVEHELAAAMSVDGIPGLVMIRVTAVDLDSEADDEGATAVLTYDVACKSVIE